MCIAPADVLSRFHACAFRFSGWRSSAEKKTQGDKNPRKIKQKRTVSTAYARAAIISHVNRCKCCSTVQCLDIAALFYGNREQGSMTYYQRVASTAYLKMEGLKNAYIVLRQHQRPPVLPPQPDQRLSDTDINGTMPKESV